MSQGTFPLSASQSGTEFVEDLNALLKGINSNNAAATAPESGLEEGVLWLDTSTPATPVLKIYDASAGNFIVLGVNGDAFRSVVIYINSSTTPDRPLITTVVLNGTVDGFTTNTTPAWGLIQETPGSGENTFASVGTFTQANNTGPYTILSGAWSTPAQLSGNDGSTGARSAVIGFYVPMVTRTNSTTFTSALADFDVSSLSSGGTISTTPSNQNYLDASFSQFFFTNLTSDAVEGDYGVFYNNSDETQNIVASYDAANNRWVTGTKKISGNLLVDGSITTDSLSATAITGKTVAGGKDSLGDDTSGFFLSSDGKFTVGGDANNQLKWDGSSLTIPAATITNQLVASQITAGTITANEIKTGTITATQLAADSITANKIASLELSVEKNISVGSLIIGKDTELSIETAVDDTTINVDSTADFPDSGTVSIGEIQERFTYTSKTATTLVGSAANAIETVFAVDTAVSVYVARSGTGVSLEGRGRFAVGNELNALTFDGSVLTISGVELDANDLANLSSLDGKISSSLQTYANSTAYASGNVVIDDKKIWRVEAGQTVPSNNTTAPSENSALWEEISPGTVFTIDAAITENSANPTQGGAVFTALADKQAADATLTAIAGLTAADGGFIVGTGAAEGNWTVESGADARTSLGLGTVATLNTGTGSGNIPILNTNGKISSAVLDIVNLSDVENFTTIALRNASVATIWHKGDIAIITTGTDLGTYLYTGTDQTTAAATLSSAWTVLQLPTGVVSSITGGDGITASSSTGTVTVSITDDGVTYDKIQNVATDTILGRTASGTGSVTALSSTETLGVLGITSTATELNYLDIDTLTKADLTKLAGITSSADELNLLDDVTGLVKADLTKLAAIDATATEIDVLNGATNLVTADLTKLADVTSSAAELNLLDDVTGLVKADFTKLAAVDATATEIDVLNGATNLVTADLTKLADVTSSAAELNLLDDVTGLVKADFTKLAAVTSSADELNLLDDVTGLVKADLTKLAAIDATATEIDVLNGATNLVTADLTKLADVTSSAAELNLLDDVTGLVKADLTKLAAITSSADELNLLDDVTGLVKADFTKLAAVTSSSTELNLLDDVTGLVKADLTKLAAIDASAAEIDVLNGATNLVTADLTKLADVTASAAEINVLNGATNLVTADLTKLAAVDATAAEIDVLNGATNLVTADLTKLADVTSSAAELNLLDDVTGLVKADLTKLAAIDATAAEIDVLNGATDLVTADLTKLAGVTATAAELNRLDTTVGTPGSTTFLRGDNSWVTPAGTTYSTTNKLSGLFIVDDSITSAQLGPGSVENSELGIGTVSIDKMAITEFPTVVWKTSYKTNRVTSPANAGEWQVFTNTALTTVAGNNVAWDTISGIKLRTTDGGTIGRDITELINALETGSYLRINQSATQYGVFKIGTTHTVSGSVGSISFDSDFQSEGTYSNTASAFVDFQVNTDAIIDGNLIVTGSINAESIKADNAAFSKLAADTATFGTVTTDFLSATTVVADTVWAAKINAGAINAEKLVANSITANEILSDTITANEIDVNTLNIQDMNLTGTLTVDTEESGAIRWGKTDGDDNETPGLFMGNQFAIVSSGNSRNSNAGGRDTSGQITSSGTWDLRDGSDDLTALTVSYSTWDEWVGNFYLNRFPDSDFRFVGTPYRDASTGTSFQFTFTDPSNSAITATFNVTKVVADTSEIGISIDSLVSQAGTPPTATTGWDMDMLVVQQRMVFGSASAYVWYDGSNVFLVGTTVVNDDGTNVQIITRTEFLDGATNPQELIYTPSPLRPRIKLEMLAGGAGASTGGNSNSRCTGGAGGDTVVIVEMVDASDPSGFSERLSWTVGGGSTSTSTAGGSGGSTGSVGADGIIVIDSENGLAASTSTGGDGGAIDVASRTSPTFDGVGGSGGAFAGFGGSQGGSASGVGAGGGGAGGQGGYSRGGGGSGGYQEILYTLVSNTDRIRVTSLGGGGAGCSKNGNPGSGSGTEGVVRITGAD